MPSEPSFPLAPLGRRASAWLLDVGLGSVLALGFVDVAGGRGDLRAAWQLVAFKSVNGKSGHQLSAAMSPGGMNFATMKPVLGLLLLLGVVAGAGVAYRVITTAVWGAGIGKWLLGIRVVVDACGATAAPTPPGWARAWKRWAVPQAPGLIPLPATSVLAYLPAAKDHRRRGLHDRAAGTIVVDVRAERVESRPAPAEPARAPWRLSSLDAYPTLDGFHPPAAVGVLAGAAE
jgi:uncharacterized RDD family membrane protein YckC